MLYSVVAPENEGSGNGFFLFFSWQPLIFHLLSSTRSWILLVVALDPDAAGIQLDCFSNECWLSRCCCCCYVRDAVLFDKSRKEVVEDEMPVSLSLSSLPSSSLVEQVEMWLKSLLRRCASCLKTEMLFQDWERHRQRKKMKLMMIKKMTEVMQQENDADEERLDVEEKTQWDITTKKEMQRNELQSWRKLH